MDGDSQPKKCMDLETRTRSHMEKLDSLDLKPHHVDDRPQSVTTYGFLKSIFLWLFAWSFMVGFVTFSAIVGSFPPFLFVVSIDRIFGPKMEDSKRGALKLYTALARLPNMVVNLSICIHLGSTLRFKPSRWFSRLQRNYPVLVLTSSIPCSALDAVVDAHCR